MVEYNDIFLEELVRSGLVEESQALELMDERERSGKPVRVLAQELGLITEEQGLDLIARVQGAEQVGPGAYERACRNVAGRSRQCGPHVFHHAG